MPSPFEFLLGTLSGIRGAFARFFRGRAGIPDVPTLASQLRSRLHGLAADVALDAARRLIAAKEAGQRLNSADPVSMVGHHAIPRAPLFDVPFAQPGDVVGEVLVTAQSVDPAGQTTTTSQTEIIVVSDQSSVAELQTLVIDVAAQRPNYPLGVGQAVIVGTEFLWVFTVGD